MLRVFIILTTVCLTAISDVQAQQNFPERAARPKTVSNSKIERPDYPSQSLKQQITAKYPTMDAYLLGDWVLHSFELKTFGDSVDKEYVRKTEVRLQQIIDESSYKRNIHKFESNRKYTYTFYKDEKKYVLDAEAYCTYIFDRTKEDLIMGGIILENKEISPPLEVNIRALLLIEPIAFADIDLNHISFEKILSKDVSVILRFNRVSNR